MERDETANIQDGFLGRARKERAVLTVMLNSGKKIVGRIRSFDRYTLVLEDRGVEQMIFKHAIATITIGRSFANRIPIGAGGEGEPDRPGGGPPAGTGAD